MGRKFSGKSGGFLGFGIVLTIAKNNSESISSLTHLFNKVVIVAPISSLFNSYAIHSVSKPKTPGAELVFIVPTTNRNSSKVNSSLRLSNTFYGN